MDTQIHTVLDLKADAYLQPFFSKNEAVAIRSFQTASQDPEHLFAQHPLDYILVHLGSYNETTGAITALDSPMPIGSAHDFRKTQEELI